MIFNIKDPLKKTSVNVAETKSCLKITLVWAKCRSSATENITENYTIMTCK